VIGLSLAWARGLRREKAAERYFEDSRLRYGRKRAQVFGVLGDDWTGRDVWDLEMVGVQRRKLRREGWLRWSRYCCGRMNGVETNVVFVR